MTSRFVSIVDAVETALDDDTVVFAKGRKSLHLHEAPRRITAIPVSADLTSHRHNVGGRAHPATGNLEPSILTRTLSVEWHVWGMTTEDEASQFERTEQLLHDLYAAIRSECMGFVRFQSEDWITQTEEAADYAAAAEYAVATVAFDIPVAAESRNVTTITSEGTTITHEGVSGDEIVHIRPAP